MVCDEERWAWQGALEFGCECGRRAVDGDVREWQAESYKEREKGWRAASYTEGEISVGN